MVGSAFTQRGVLLVEQPGAWGRAGLEDSDFDADIARQLQARADELDLRLFAIRRPERTAPHQRAWAVRPPGSAHTFWGGFEDDAELLSVPLDGSAGRRSEEPAYLVCTHAKRDQCCAVFARPIAFALEAIRPGQVWGCSHTGGHRFAPVVVALPTATSRSAMYGRVSADDLPELVAATEAGRSVPRLLRGLNGHSGPAQTAIAVAMSDSGNHGLDDWHVVDEDDSRVDLSGPLGVLSYRIETTVDAEPMVSCGKPAPSDQTHFAASLLT
jgi:hypothetical protein